jgi:glutamate-1-semialdehyde 2,1-aminomutase
LELLDKKTFDYIDSLCERLDQGFEKEIKKRKLPISITRDGSLLNIHMIAEKPYDYETAYEANKDIGKLWHLEMLNRGIFPAQRGLFVISTVMTEEVIDKTTAVFAEVLEVIGPFL